MQARSSLSPAGVLLKHHRFQLRDLPLHLQPQKGEFWFPQHVTPWFYLQSYQQLPMAVSRRYNQLYALASHEAFIALERDFICPILNHILATQGIPSELASSLQAFSEEEFKHAEMFRLINQAAEPGFYRDSDYFLSNGEGRWSLYWLKKIAAHYRLFGVWIWVAMFFEERSVMYSKEFIRCKEYPLSELFREAHKLHLLEEVYHLHLDEELVERFYRPLGRVRRWLSRVMLKSILASYVAPRKMSRTIAGQLKREFSDPAIHRAIDRCLQELPLVRFNADFRAQVFNDDATRRFKKLLRGFSEMEPVLSLLSNI